MLLAAPWIAGALGCSPIAPFAQPAPDAGVMAHASATRDADVALDKAMRAPRKLRRDATPKTR